MAFAAAFLFIYFISLSVFFIGYFYMLRNKIRLSTINKIAVFLFLLLLTEAGNYIFLRLNTEFVSDLGFIEIILCIFIEGIAVGFSAVTIFEFHRFYLRTLKVQRAAAENLNELVKYLSKKIQTFENEVAYDKEKLSKYVKKESYVSEEFLVRALGVMASLSRTDSFMARKLAIDLKDYIERAGSFNQSMIRVKKEIELVKLYFSIERQCLKNEIKLFTDIPEELLNNYVPAFLILPLVDNAINHGINLKPSGGMVFIKILKENGMLEIRVDDTGVGMPGERLEEVLKHYPGSGLKLVSEILKDSYGDKYKFEITSSMEEGTRVTICIPLDL